MGKINQGELVKIVVGLISRDIKLFDVAASAISSKLGPIDSKSDVLPFNHTAYYESEMGNNLKRSFVSLRKLRKPDAAERIKVFTNKLEKMFSVSGNRAINIDPGYLTAAKLVLLTTKNYSHRVYINKGIYGEVTLYFKNGEFHPWQWTFPDYKTAPYRNFFGRVRDIYMGQLYKK